MENQEENLPVTHTSTDLEEIKSERFNHALFKVGDEVVVHVDEGLQLMGEWTLPMSSEIGIISKVLVHDSLAIGYVIDQVGKFSLRKTEEQLEMFGSRVILEGFIQKCPFDEVRMHNFKSYVVSKFFRQSDRGGPAGGTTSMSFKAQIEMQMKFYEYGKTGVFPPEWGNYPKPIIFSGEN